MRRSKSLPEGRSLGSSAAEETDMLQAQLMPRFDRQRGLSRRRHRWVLDIERLESETRMVLQTSLVAVPISLLEQVAGRLPVEWRHRSDLDSQRLEFFFSDVEEPSLCRCHRQVSMPLRSRRHQTGSLTRKNWNSRDRSNSLAPHLQLESRDHIATASRSC